MQVRKFVALLNKTSPFSIEAQTHWQLATFGAGCFWCVEATFRGVSGVCDTVVGYMGGTLPDPTYAEICLGETGHAEVVHLLYDPQKISYRELLALFWNVHDPTTPNQQGEDIGTQYRSVIFCHSVEQWDEAHASVKRHLSSGRYANPIVTQIEWSSVFYKAEDFHQQYLQRRDAMIELF